VSLGEESAPRLESNRGKDSELHRDWAVIDVPAAKRARAPQPTVWSADKERERLPVSGNAERPLPNARRDVPGCPEG
jgi:hypothetical protein